MRTVTGRYRLDEEIGRGGAGVVWRGEDTLLRRPVAVKEVEASAQRERVLREARAAARVSHPRLVTIFDVVEDDGRIFLVQELVPGRSLKDAVRDHGPMAPDRVREIGLQLVAALDVLHREGIVHRDVKPGNVMLMPDGSAKLADLGIAAVAGDPDLTKTGIILGSPHYMAPEQAVGERVDHRADLWSLGATLYFAVEGHAPFDGPTWAAMNKIVHDPLPEPVRAGALAPVIRRLTEKEPARRPTLDETRRMLIDEPTVAYAPPTRSVRTSSTSGRGSAHRTQGGRAWAVALVAVIALLAGGFAVAASLGDEDAPPDETASPTTTEAPATTQAPTTTARPTTTTEAASRGGTDTFTNEAAGYSIAYPVGWTVERRGERIVDLVEPDTGTYLRIDWTADPGPSPKGAWEQQEKSFSQKEDYRRIRMTEETYQGHPASLWEYTYRAEGADLHAYNLGFVTDSRGFALNFQTREENWGAAQDTWEQLKADFTIRS